MELPCTGPSGQYCTWYMHPPMWPMHVSVVCDRGLRRSLEKLRRQLGCIETQARTVARLKSRAKSPMALFPKETVQPFNRPMRQFTTDRRDQFRLAVDVAAQGGGLRPTNQFAQKGRGACFEATINHCFHCCKDNDLSIDCSVPFI